MLAVVLLRAGVKDGKYVVSAQYNILLN